MQGAEHSGGDSSLKMKELVQMLDSADANIHANNVNTITNAEKDRFRAKKRQDEMRQMQEDYEKNIRADPAEMDKTVKQEVEVALLRMAEKKMMVEM